MHRKWRRIILYLVITTIVLVVGSYCYEVYLTEKALNDVCMNENGCTARRTKDRANRENLDILAKQSVAESNTHLNYESVHYSEQTLDWNNERQPLMSVDDLEGNEEFEQLDSKTSTTLKHQTSKEDSYQYEDQTVSTYPLLRISKLSSETPVHGIEKLNQMATDLTRDNVKITNIGKQIPAIPKLLWWDFYSHGAGKDDFITCKQGVKCHVVSNRSLTDHPDTMAIIYYGTHFYFMDLPKHRRQEITWAVIHEESPKNADFLFNHEEILSLFNYTATFKRESDYPITTHFLPSISYLQSKQYLVSTQDKNRYQTEENLAPIFYIHSDCNVPSNRDVYVELLQKFIRVDSYGKCNNNKALPESLSFGKSMAPMTSKEFYELGAKYKFTLAMENAVCDDYITEKLWRPFHLGSVPIVFGSPKIKDYLPNKKSAVVINDFDDVEKLAAFIKYLDRNDTAYEEYLQYKEPRGLTNTFLIDSINKREWSKYHDKTKPFYSLFSGFECYICEEMHKNIDIIKSGKELPVKIAKLDHYGCPPPKRFSDTGQYTVIDPRFSYYWYEGKYRAKAFRYFYDKKMNFTEKDIATLAKSFRQEYMDDG
ncbi:alpha-(1,3)-fucosyltransferase 11-like [Mytilus californianus]|uniref:alpha-(1,3)-fucosyltransferase 11-like n=1 Tax=Mytilus californianus TaxID=6549 RepID=UPI002245DBA1|nr:alpha-(1,3)-fucosyltransferase 11-like [Mytilus californianus]